MNNNPTAEYMMRLRAAAIHAVSEDTIREIFLELANKAKKGDLNAAKLLFAHVLPPQPTVQAIQVQTEQRRPKLPVHSVIETRILPHQHNGQEGT